MLLVLLFSLINAMLFDHPAYTISTHSYFVFDPHYLWRYEAFANLLASSSHLTKALTVDTQTCTIYDDMQWF